MKERNIGPLSEAAHGFSQSIACGLCDLIDLPDAGVEKEAAHHPAQILGRGEAVVSQLHGFFDESLDIGWDPGGFEELPQMDVRDADEPLPIKGHIAVQGQKIQVGACSIGDASEEMGTGLMAEPAHAFGEWSLEPGLQIRIGFDELTPDLQVIVPRPQAPVMLEDKGSIGFFARMLRCEQRGRVANDGHGHGISSWPKARRYSATTVGSETWV